MLSDCGKCRYLTRENGEVHCTVDAYYVSAWEKAKDWDSNQQELLYPCPDFAASPYEQKVSLPIELSIKEWLKVASGVDCITATKANQLSQTIVQKLREQFPELTIEVDDDFPF